MFTLEQILPSAYKLEPRDQVEYVSPGTYSFVVPADVKTVSAVAVGAGGGGAETNDGGGGGGGALQYVNDIPVTEGEVLTVVVGSPGQNGTNGTSGGYSAIVRGSALNLYGGNLYDDFEQISFDTARYSSYAGVQVSSFGSGSGSSGGFANSGLFGSSKYLAFVTGTMRQVTTLPLNLSDATKIRFRYIYGNSKNGGENVDAGENLALLFSTSLGNASSNSGYTVQTNIPYNYSWTDFSFEIPDQWRIPGVYVRISQVNSSGFPFDSIGIDQFIIERKSEILVYAEGGKGGKGPYGGAGGIASGNSAVPIPYDTNGSSLPVVYSGTLDDGFVTVNLPFSVSFLGNNYSTVYVNSNGYITFNSGSGSFSFSNSSPNQPHILIYPGNRRLLTLYAGAVNDPQKFVIRQVGRNFSNSTSNLYEIHFYPGAPYFDIFFVRNPGEHAVTPRVGDGQRIYTTFTPSNGSAVRVSTFPPTAVTFGGASGGNGGSGSRAFGGDFLTGGGGGAAGYTGNGGRGGDGQNAAGRASGGGGGGGGNADNANAIGGGGVGLKGLGNNGRANGGGGSSYSNNSSAAARASNSQVDFYPVTLSYAWGSFMNTYAVWYADGTWRRSFYAPVTGIYFVKVGIDNRITLQIDGVTILVKRGGFGSEPEPIPVNLTQGYHVFTFIVENFGGPAGWAVTLTDPFGNLIWDTRTYRLRGDINEETLGIGGTDSPSAFKSSGGGTAASSGGFFGGGGGGGDGNAAGRGGKGGVRIIWGSNRSYPYRANDVIPFRRTPTSGLILHYDASVADSYTGGSEIRDISGNGNTGTVSTGYVPTFPAFVGNNSVFRFPVDQNTKIDFVADELTSSKISVEMWAVVYQFSGGMFFGFNLHDVWTSAGRLGFNTGQGDVFGLSASQVNALGLTNRWVHYVFVMNAGDYTANKIYIDADRQPISQQTGRQSTSLANFNTGVGRIGGWRASTDYQQWMDLAIFKIWNRELTQQEISATYFDYKNRFLELGYFSGLWGRRYNGYFADNVNFFTGTVVESRAVGNISGFTSSIDQYSWEFKGYFRAPASGTYNFQLYSDDASYLWLGSTALSGFNTGNALVPHGGLHPPTFSGVYSVFLYSGNYYPIRIQFGENFGQDVLSVLITGPGISGTSNGEGYFFHDVSSRS